MAICWIRELQKNVLLSKFHGDLPGSKEVCFDYKTVMMEGCSKGRRVEFVRKLCSRFGRKVK